MCIGMHRNIGNISVLNREGDSVDITQAHKFVQDMPVRTISPPRSEHNNRSRSLISETPLCLLRI